MTDTAPVIHRADYAPFAFLVEAVDLAFDIDARRVAVRATLSLRRNPAVAVTAPLRLDGRGLDTRAVVLDGRALGGGAYRLEGDQLVIADLPEGPFRLTTEVEINPYANTALQGLYQSGGMLCTQCEAEGFRHITWYPDRPDVMARFRVAITAAAGRWPVLLSNGNPVETTTLPDGRHRAVWDDPFPKPAYLFALVAGDLACVEGDFTTRSGRRVALKFWVEHGNADQVGHALASLQKAMKWDEDVFGLEYDLDIYNVVAVSHFNMGAMENKSLNIFNSKYVLAKQATATDDDFMGIESVIAHEYFHNWTGNRVTCRDWFQLTLKEGLTVFRDQQFSGDMHSRAFFRVGTVSGLRGGQFPEDSGPMAHPIRPDSYVEINNFYTATVYQKGAEVIRMIHTLIGAPAFRRGMDLYFARHDGQAVTCEDFVAAMEDASGVDLGQFRRWYSQAGTPQVTASWRHDPAARTWALTLAQATPPTPGQPDTAPLHIPVRLGLVAADGHDVPLRLAGENEAHGTTRVVDLTGAEQTFLFEDVAEPVVPSLFRDFSAPVKVSAPLTAADLAFLARHDSDPVARWDSGHQLAIATILDLVQARADGRPLTLDEGFAAAWGASLAGAAADPAFTVHALGLPSPTAVGERMAVIDVDGIHAARKFLYGQLAERFGPQLAALRDSLAEDGYSLTMAAMGRRFLRNFALGVLAERPDDRLRAVAQTQAATARCMSDQIGALAALVTMGADFAIPALAAFLAQWKDEPLVVNKWLSLRAYCDWPDVLDRVRALLDHPAFDRAEPNKVYALIGGFTGNAVHFHRADGAGYAFIADQVAALDATNPQIAARLVRSLIRWRRYDPRRQALMRAQLERLAALPSLSRDTGEIVARGLA